MKTHNRWTAPLLLALCASILAGCGPTEVEQLESQVDELQTQIVDLQGKLDSAQAKTTDIESAVEELRAASDELQSSVGNLDDTNWSEVVPEIQSAASDVDRKLTEVESSVSKAVSALD